MVGGHEEILNVVIFNGLHALDALAAPVLALEIVHIHALDVSQMGHGNDRVLIRDQILHAHIIVVPDGGTAVVPVFVGDDLNFFFYHSEKLLLIRKDCL